MTAEKTTNFFINGWARCQSFATSPFNTFIENMNSYKCLMPTSALVSAQDLQTYCLYVRVLLYENRTSSFNTKPTLTMMMEYKHIKNIQPYFVRTISCFILWLLGKFSSTYVDSSYLGIQSKIITVLVCQCRLNYCSHLPSQADLKVRSFKLTSSDIKLILFGWTLKLCRMWIISNYDMALRYSSVLLW